MNFSKFSVLGSNSFAGTQLIQKLLYSDVAVQGFSRSSSKPNIFINPAVKNHQNYKFIQTDINNNLNDMFIHLEAFKPDVIFDFMGQGMVAESWYKPEQWFTTNVLSKVKLFNFLSNYKFLKKYIRISTPEVYGSSQNLLKEDSTYNPSTPYAVTHMTIDAYLKIIFEKSKFPVIIMRFSNFYGESQPFYRIIPKTIISIINKKKLPLHGKGLSLRSFIYIDDFCAAIFKGIKKGKIGETYNVSSNEVFSIAEIVKIICLKMNYNYNYLIKYQKDRPSKDFRYFMNNDKAKKKLGWNNKISFSEGLDRTIKWYYKNLKDFKNIKYDYIHKK